MHPDHIPFPPSHPCALPQSLTLWLRLASSPWSFSCLRLLSTESTSIAYTLQGICFKNHKGAEMMVSVGQGVGYTGNRPLVQISLPMEKLGAGCIAIILVLGTDRRILGTQ